MPARPRTSGFLTVTLLMTAAAAMAAPASPATVVLGVNDLAVRISNVGSFAYDFGPPYDRGGLEFPRGSGRFAAFAGGVWLAGQAGPIRAAVAEFGWNWSPGPIAGGSPSTEATTGALFERTVWDTAGTAAWEQRAVPLGAPASFPGDAAVWTVFNDLDRTDVWPAWGPDPVGAEGRLTAFAWDRTGPLARTVFLEWTLIAKGGWTLDSARVGLFLDPKATGGVVLASYDSARAMGYAWRTSDTDPGFGDYAPAVGLMVLDVRAGGVRLPPSAFTVYPNGTDPTDSLAILNVLRGRLATGADMIDPVTGQPVRFWSTGDPVTGTGSVAPGPIHPHTVLAAGPFRFAPGDTVSVAAALMAGLASDHLASITALRATADSVRRLLDGTDPFPPPRERPAGVRMWPNPSPAGARLQFTVANGGAGVVIDVYSPAGRRVRRLWNGAMISGVRTIEWDGRDERGARAPAGLYFVRTAIGGRVQVARLAIVR